MLLHWIVVVGLIAPGWVYEDASAKQFRCEKGYIQERIHYLPDVDIWVYITDKETGKLIPCHWI